MTSSPARSWVPVFAAGAVAAVVVGAVVVVAGAVVVGCVVVGASVVVVGCDVVVAVRSWSTRWSGRASCSRAPSRRRR